MFTKITEWILKSRGVKIGGGILGGGGAMLLILALYSEVNGKIAKQDIDQKLYVHLVIEPIKTEISNLKTGQNEVKSMVRDIHNYLLKSKTTQ